MEDSQRNDENFDTKKIVGNMHCGYDPRHGKCPDECNNRKWMFLNKVQGMFNTDLRAWKRDDSISIYACKVA